jgi:hypothetical protein
VAEGGDKVFVAEKFAIQSNDNYAASAIKLLPNPALSKS